MAQDGRHHAVEEAKRWIERMRPQDLAMVTAYASDAGLTMPAGFTGNKAELLAAVDGFYGSTEMNDPFPVVRSSRMKECRVICETGLPPCDVCWLQLAWDERRNGRHSFEALKTLLVRLGDLPGRKALVFFHQNGTLSPARYYPVDESRVGDHIRLVEEVGAEATLSRVAVYSAFSGEKANDLAVNLGANLADYTGGGYNRSLSGLSDLTRQAGAKCACTYRIGLLPPEAHAGHIYRLVVEVRDRRLPNTYRVQYLSEADRWMRSARAVLANPDSAKEVPLVASILPVSAGREGWDVKVQVALDVPSVALLPGESGNKGSWEVGALLFDLKARRTFEMLGISELRRSGRAESRMAVLHERTIEGIRPGTYELRAFVRDRVTNAYGGASVQMELPRAEKGTVAGPLVMRDGKSYLRTSLPLREEARSDPLATRDPEVGPLPLGANHIRPGESLEFHTWICPGEIGDDLDEALRYLSSNDRPILRFEQPRITRAGDCACLTDTLASPELAAGRYTYHLRWQPHADGEPRQADVSFEVELKASSASP